jgi:hypothetical protein
MDMKDKDKPVSVGEELYLVHLRRHKGEEPREEDYDHEAPRKRQHDVGEELWEVHVKRSRGIEPDPDLEREDKHKKSEEPTTPRKGSFECRYHLRSRDSPKKLS